MVDYHLSGGIAARVGGREIALGGTKQRCILAVLLASHGSVVSVDKIIDAVWEGDAPSKAVTSVRSYVANLRRLLNAVEPDDTDPPRLEGRQNGYRVNLAPADTIDLGRFDEAVASAREALRNNDPGRAVGGFDQALTLWRGDPFGEFAHYDFAVADVQRLRALRVAAVEGRFDAALRLGAGAEVVPELEAAIAEYPLQERLWEFLVTALYWSGRSADALNAYDRARDTLRREIGVEPGRRLLDLVHEIKAGPMRAAAPRTADESTASLPFVGRGDELRDVDAGVRQAVAGRGGLTLITGESGIGKTALVLNGSRLARDSGVAVAWAAHPADIRLPLLWTWIQVLRQVAADLGEPGRHAVRRAAPGVVGALVPEWSLDDTGETTPTLAATGFALAEGIVTALTVLAELRPLLVILDDLQLADEATLTTLALLSAELPRIPVRIIGNWTFHGSDRPINPGSFQRLLTTNDIVTVQLGGLDPGAAAELVSAVTDSPADSDDADRLWEQSGGNPFYLKELARALRDDRDAGDAPPQTVLGVVGRRLSALDQPVRDVLAAASVIGPTFDVVDVSEVVELPVTTVRKRLRAAYDAGLIDEDPLRPGGYRFGHTILREAISARIAPDLRADLHAAIANTRAAALASVPYEDVVASAGHAWQAGAALNGDTALHIHEVAIGRALTRSAYEDVAALAEQALRTCRRLPPKPGYLERQATLWLHLAGASGILHGQGSAPALAAVQRALEIGAEVKGRSFYSATAVQCLMLVGHGRAGEAATIGAGLREQYESTGDPDVGLAAVFVDVMVLFLRGDFDAALAAGQHMMDTFPAPDTVADPLHFLHPRVYCWMALCRAVRGDRDGMRRDAENAMRLARSRSDVFNVLAAKLVLIESAALLGDVQGTAEAADALEAEFASAGGHQWGALATLIGIWARCLDTGGGDAAAAFEAFGVLTSDGTLAMNSYYLGLLSDIEASQGRTEHARELLTRAHQLADTTGEHAWDDFLGSRIAA